MPNIRVFAVAALAAVLLAAVAVPAQASTAASMVAEMNGARAGHGLAPLHMSDRLNRSSFSWARYLMRRDWLFHASLRAARVKGEVIEMHTGGQHKIRGALLAWLHSPEHRAILLSPRFHRVGVGMACGRFHGRKSVIWVGRFS